MNLLILLVLGVSLMGCAQVKQVQNLDELLTLKEYSEEKGAQEKWIEEEAAKFDRILAAAQDGSIKSVATQPLILERFGDPVLKEHTELDNKSVERWLYRHPIQKLAFEKVYLFFDADGRLLKYELITPPNDGQKIIDYNTHSQNL